MSDAAAASGGGEAASTAVAPEGQVSSDDGSTASAPATTEQQPPEPKYRLKVGGAEKELPISEVLKLAQKAEGVETKFREVAAQRKQLETIASRLREDPLGAMAQLIADKDKPGTKGDAARHAVQHLLRDRETRQVLEDLLWEQYQYEQLPEDERKRRDEDRELRAKAKRVDDYERAEQARQQQEMTARYAQQFEQQFTQSLQAAKVPVTPAAIARLSMLAEVALSEGQRVSLAALAAQVREEMRTEARALLSGVGDDDLDALIGEDTVRKIRARDAARLKAQTQVQVHRAPNGQFTAKGEPARKLTASEYMRKMRGG